MNKILPNECVVITDLDGTLIDSDLKNIELLTSILEKHGYKNEIENIFTGIVQGKQFNEIMKQINMTWTTRKILEKESFEKIKKRITYLLPGAKKNLGVLYKKGFGFSIVTNNSYQFTLNILKSHGLNKFFNKDLIFCYDNFDYLKPSKKIIQEINRRGKVDSLKKIIIVGNTVRDVEFAKKSNLPIIFLLSQMPEIVNNYVSLFFKKRDELNNKLSYDKLFRIDHWNDMPIIIDQILQNFI